MKHMHCPFCRTTHDPEDYGCRFPTCRECGREFCAICGNDTLRLCEGCEDTWRKEQAAIEEEEDAREQQAAEQHEMETADWWGLPPAGD